MPASLTYHICDVYLEELDKVIAAASSSDPSLAPAPLFPILEPFYALAARTANNVTYKHVQATVLEPLLVACETSAASDLESLVLHACLSDPREDGNVEPTRLHARLAKRLLEVGGQQETKEANRRRMYALWRAHGAEEGDGDREGANEI